MKNPLSPLNPSKQISHSTDSEIFRTPEKTPPPTASKKLSIIAFDGLSSPSDKMAYSNWKNILNCNICIGEDHEKLSSKKFLIQNMELFAKKGYKFLILEHFIQDIHQESFDKVFYNGSILDEKIVNYARKLDEDFLELPSSKETPVEGEDFYISLFYEQKRFFNFEQLIKAAVKFGIKIICAEKDILSYNARSASMPKENITPYMLEKNFGSERLKALNWNIKKIVKELETESESPKWLALVGNSHVNHYNGVDGICDIIDNVQDFVISDSIDGTKDFKISTRKNLKHCCDNKEAKCSILLTAPLNQSLEFDSLSPEIYESSLRKREIDFSDPKTSIKRASLSFSETSPSKLSILPR